MRFSPEDFSKEGRGRLPPAPLGTGGDFQGREGGRPPRFSPRKALVFGLFGPFFGPRSSGVRHRGSATRWPNAALRPGSNEAGHGPLRPTVPELWPFDRKQSTYKLTGPCKVNGNLLDPQRGSGGGPRAAPGLEQPPPGSGDPENRSPVLLYTFWRELFAKRTLFQE